MRIEKARPADAQALTKVLLASKKTWGYPEEWLELWNDELKILPQTIRSRHFWVGRNEREIVFFYSVRHMAGSKYELEDCWVAPPYIGKGFGRMLFEHLKETLRDLGCSQLLICSDPNAEGFYRRMGAIRAGEQLSKMAGRGLPLLEYDPWI